MKIHHQDSIFKPPFTSSHSPLFKSQKTHDDSPLPLPLRVADVLLFDDKDDDVLDELLMMGGEARCRGWQRSSSCYPPHRIAARWISGLRRNRVKESKKDELGGDGTVQVRRSMKGLNEQDSRNSASEITVSGKKKNQYKILTNWSGKGVKNYIFLVFSGFFFLLYLGNEKPKK
jgi:hypothetical protein